MDFGDSSSAFAPSWTYPGSEDAEIYMNLETTQNPDNGQSEVFEVSLFADQLSSDSAFIGDYDEALTDTVRCDVFVEDINSFQELEVYFLSGETFYYSEVFGLERIRLGLDRNQLQQGTNGISLTIRIGPFSWSK